MVLTQEQRIPRWYGCADEQDTDESSYPVMIWRLLTSTSFSNTY